MEEDLIIFINEKMIKKKNITLELGMEKDLGFDGDEAAYFLDDYSEKFNVNIDNFNFEKYFTLENPLFYYLFKFIPYFNAKSHELTVRNLLDGIYAGRLDDSIISNSNKQNK